MRNRLTKMNQETLSVQQKLKIYDPKEGYDKVAGNYQSWHWHQFWMTYETRIVKDWLCGLNSGVGLDAGSGTGPYLDIVYELGHNYIAIDLSTKMLEVGRRQNRNCCNKGRSHQIIGDIRRTMFPDKYFSWLLCTRVLSHIDNIQVVLNEFARILRPQGSCLITDIHPLHPYEYTSIPSHNDKITIRSYKHPLKEFMNMIHNTGKLKLIKIQEYVLDDLYPQPPRNLFKKLYYSNKTPIFYACWLIRI